MFYQFELIEPYTPSEVERLPNSLKLSKPIREEAKLFRLLVGSLSVKNNITQEILPQKLNYSYLGFKENTRFSQKMFSDFLGGSNGLVKIDEYFKSSNQRNNPLFKDLVYEYCFYFDCNNRKEDTLSFLYLYRILERMSYTFPMLYASRATDYMGTWKILQNYFQESNSELKFFNLFILDFFEEDFLINEVVIDITAYNDEIREKYFKIIKTLCLNSSPNINIISETEFSKITIANKDIINLMVNLRNRYFHFASGGQRNINSGELIEPNQFFSCLNKHFAYWLSFTYFELIKNAIK